MTEITIKGKIQLKKDSPILIQTEAGHELYILWTGDVRVTVCNESNVDRKGREMGVFWTEGSVAADEA
jgi:hypothetical protein